VGLVTMGSGSYWGGGGSLDYSCEHVVVICTFFFFFALGMDSGSYGRGLWITHDYSCEHVVVICTFFFFFCTRNVNLV
jgi:hypothetical protein